MRGFKKAFQIIVLFIFLVSYGQQESFKVDVKGKGKPILLFPGFTCTGAVWDDLVKQLEITNECHVFTFAGFGGVPAIEKPWLPKIKVAIEEYVLEKNLEEATIIGHSLGGTLALWLASEEKSKFKQLIVVDALPGTGALMMPNYKSENMVYDNPYNKQLLEMDNPSFEKMAIQMANGMVLNKEKQVQIAAWMVQADRETYVYGYTDYLKLDLRETISTIKSPVLLLAAIQPYGLEMAKNTYDKQYKNLKNYEIGFAEESAHFIMYDQPKWFVEKVKAYLK